MQSLADKSHGAIKLHPLSGKTGRVRLAKMFIERGAAGIHIEDVFSAVRFDS